MAEWVRGEIEPCTYCGGAVYVGADSAVGVGGRGVGHPMGETYAHYHCKSELLLEAVKDLQRRLYLAESVCWAAFRVSEVGEGAVDPAADRQFLAGAWSAWKDSVGA